MTNKRASAQPHRRPMLAAVAAMLALTSMAVSVAQQQKTTTTTTTTAAAAGPGVTIKNFGKVNENYYRGAQPDREEFDELKRLGVKTVIDLRKDSKREAPEWVRAAGMRYVNIPLTASQPATEEETAHFLELVNDPANWPVYVHCKGGRHRTGALTAAYRITHDGWTADQAFREMEQYDFNNSIFGGGGRARQKKFVYNLYERQRSARDGSK